MNIIFGILVLLLVVVGGAYYLGTQKTNVSTNTNQYTTSSAPPTAQIFPTTSPTETTNQQTSSIPSDWTLKSSTYCGIKFPLPPKKDPYYSPDDPNRTPSVTEELGSGRFWQVRETDSASGGGKDSIFTAVTAIMHVSDTETSGFISGGIFIRCVPNTNSYTLANIAESYASGAGTGIKVKSKRTTKIWGKDVVAAKFEGEMFSDNEIYFVIAGNFDYKINKISNSDKEFVRNTTDQIFDNLQFSN